MTNLTKNSRSEVRLHFFELLFGDTEGVFTIATSDQRVPQASWKQHFFKYPDDILKIENFILKHEKTLNIYFCINLLSKYERKKEHCLPTNLLWADLDESNPMELKAPPPIIIRTSPDRFQGIWRLSTSLPAAQAEEYSRRLAYSTGADRSGWDLTQMLRVPFTRNWKYPDAPIIDIISIGETTAPPLVFEALEDPTTIGAEGVEVPSDIPPAEEVLYKYAAQIRNSAFSALFGQTPEKDEDWSSILWRLLNLCIEAGMSPEEVFSVTRQASCNKYARDGRPESHLWKDILKATKTQENLYILSSAFKPLHMPQLVSGPASETFIDTYRSWASEATDAVVAFHDLSSTILLSAVISNSVRLDTSYGQMVPNLWGLVLGDSTLTRKTTAMKMAVDILNQIDPNVIVATDGSPEGLLTGLEQRPNKVSVFYKDEVSGFFDSINRKDYLAGMPEILTALYDVPPIYTRLLRKSTIRIEQPAFSFLGEVSRIVYMTISPKNTSYQVFFLVSLWYQGKTHSTNYAGPDHLLRWELVNGILSLRMLLTCGSGMQQRL